MCQITAPPAVFLAGPLHAPLGWLLIAGVLAFIVVAVPSAYRKYLRQHPSALYRRVGFAVLGGALLALCTSLVIVVLVVLPSNDALAAWQDSQYATLGASHCAVTASTALYDTYDRQLQGLITTWLFVAFAFLFVALGPLFIWFFWFARRPRAQAARQ